MTPASFVDFVTAMFYYMFKRFPPDDKSAKGALPGDGVVGGVICLTSSTFYAGAPLLS